MVLCERLSSIVETGPRIRNRTFSFRWILIEDQILFQNVPPVVARCFQLGDEPGDINVPFAQRFEDAVDYGLPERKVAAPNPLRHLAINILQVNMRHPPLRRLRHRHRISPSKEQVPGVEAELDIAVGQQRTMTFWRLDRKIVHSCSVISTLWS